jgi:hypothetical protein
LVGYGEHCHFTANDLVSHGIGKVFEVVEVKTVLVFWSAGGGFLQAIDCVVYLRAESVGSQRTFVKVPKKGAAHLRFCLRKNGDGEASHSERKRCFTSAQGMARMLPARSSSRRRLSSARHASETVRGVGALKAIKQRDGNCRAFFIGQCECFVQNVAYPRVHGAESSN